MSLDTIAKERKVKPLSRLQNFNLSKKILNQNYVNSSKYQTGAFFKAKF